MEIQAQKNSEWARRKNGVKYVSKDQLYEPGDQRVDHLKDGFQYQKEEEESNSNCSLYLLGGTAVFMYTTTLYWTGKYGLGQWSKTCHFFCIQ